MNTHTDLEDGLVCLIHMRSQSSRHRTLRVYSVLLKSDVSPSFVCLSSNGAIVCGHCKSRRCDHAHYVNKYMFSDEGDICTSDDDDETDSSEINSEADVSDAVANLGFSTKTISIPRSVCIDEEEEKETPPSISPIIRAEYECEINTCPSCNAPLARSPRAVTAVLYDTDRAFNVRVIDKHCNSCVKYFHYDGRDDNIYNHNNHKLFTHRLLNQYTLEYTAAAVPFHSFISMKKRAYASEHQSPAFCCQESFQSAWFNFVQLQGWKFKYMCPSKYYHQSYT